MVIQQSPMTRAIHQGRPRDRESQGISSRAPEAQKHLRQDRHTISNPICLIHYNKKSNLIYKLLNPFQPPGRAPVPRPGQSL